MTLNFPVTRFTNKNGWFFLDPITNVDFPSLSVDGVQSSAGACDFISEKNFSLFSSVAYEWTRTCFSGLKIHNFVYLKTDYYLYCVFYLRLFIYSELLLILLFIVIYMLINEIHQILWLNK